MRLRGAVVVLVAAAGAMGALSARVAHGQGAPPAPAPATSPHERALSSMRRGLSWLAARQHPNGSFGAIPGTDPSAGEAGMSALALRVMAKAPQELRKELDERMEKTARYLMTLQKPDGSISNPGAGLTTYRTAIAVSAFQAWNPTAAAEAIAKGRAFLEKTQWSESNGIGPDEASARQSPYYGGWGYDEHTGTHPEADMSNAQFAIEALREAGLPKDSPVWKRAVLFLSRCQNRSESNDLAPAGRVKVGDDGGFMYDPGIARDKSTPVTRPDGTVEIPSYASVTYAGLMSLLYANVARDDPRVQGALHWIEKHYTLEQNSGLGGRSNPEGAKQGLYYYFHAFAKALNAWGETKVKGADGAMHSWPEELVTRLAELQKPEGFWVNEVPRWWEKDPTLCTCYALLALELADANLEANR